MNSLESGAIPNTLSKSPWMFASTKVGGSKKTGKKRRNKSVKNKTRRRRLRIYNKKYKPNYLDIFIYIVQCPHTKLVY